MPKRTEPETSSKGESRSSPTPDSDSERAGFSAEERAAIREHREELRRSARRRTGSKADGEKDVLAKISEMDEPDRTMATRVHAIVTETAPDLVPRTWYGMPAYAKDGNVLCYFRNAGKFKTRYATLGFSDKAQLDEGSMWPTDFAVKEITPADEKRIAELVTKAVG